MTIDCNYPTDTTDIRPNEHLGTAPNELVECDGIRMGVWILDAPGDTRLFQTKEALVACLRENHPDYSGYSGEKFTASDTDDVVIEKASGDGFWIDWRIIEK
jgi:hypothetical protein